jgi:putative transcriptional regulator
MSTLFEELKEGLQEAIEHAQGNTRHGTRIMRREIIAPVVRSPAAIKKLRLSLGKTQEVFAQLLGVSKKTVEAWEAGTKKPNGSVLRLFQVIERDLSLVEALSFRSEAG